MTVIVMRDVFLTLPEEDLVWARRRAVEAGVKLDAFVAAVLNERRRVEALASPTNDDDLDRLRGELYLSRLKRGIR